MLYSPFPKVLPNPFQRRTWDTRITTKSKNVAFPTHSAPPALRHVLPFPAVTRLCFPPFPLPNATMGLYKTLMDDQRTAVERLTLQGHSNGAMAGHLGNSKWTVAKVTARVRR